jgi:hypothetical protein
MQQDSQFMVILKKIWPTIYRLINVTLYFLLTFLRNSVRYGWEQIKGAF